MQRIGQKRKASKQLTKDDPNSCSNKVVKKGFKKAKPEEIKNRRIVKVKRSSKQKQLEVDDNFDFSKFQSISKDPVIKEDFIGFESSTFDFGYDAPKDDEEKISPPSKKKRKLTTITQSDVKDSQKFGNDVKPSYKEICEENTQLKSMCSKFENRISLLESNYERLIGQVPSKSGDIVMGDVERPSNIDENVNNNEMDGLHLFGEDEEEEVKFDSGSFNSENIKDDVFDFSNFGGEEDGNDKEEVIKKIEKVPEEPEPKTPQKNDESGLKESDFDFSFGGKGDVGPFSHDLQTPSKYDLSIDSPRDNRSGVDFSEYTVSEEEIKQPKFDLVGEVETGEEGEDIVATCTVKLHVLTKEGEGKDVVEKWKSRGVGIIGLNFGKSDNYARLVMRMDKTHQVVLNSALFKDFPIQKLGEKKLTFSAISNSLLDKQEELGKESNVEISKVEKHVVKDPRTFLLSFRNSENLEEFLKKVVETTKKLDGGE